MSTTTPVKTQSLRVNFAGIPLALKSYPHWVLWRAVERAGKLAKVPVQPDGRTASVTNSETWCSYKKAKEAYETASFSGVGVVLTGETDARGLCLVGLDFDKLRDNLARRGHVKEILRAIGRGHVERSPSGNGARAFVYAKPFDRGAVGEGVEIYCQGRFLTITGQRIAGATEQIPDAPEAIERLVNELRGEKAPPVDTDLNADLAANVDAFPPLDIEEIRAAALATPAESWRTRDQWWRLTSALASEAIKRPEIAEDLSEIMHVASSRPGAWEATFGDEYEREANDSQWAQALRDTTKRIAEGGETITLGTLLHAAREHGWQPKNNEPDALQPDLPDVEEFRISNGFSAPYRRKPVHGGITFIGEIGMLVGMGGVAKSTYALSAALAVASGRALLDEEVTQAPVLVVNLEDSRAEMMLRLRAAMNYYGLKPADVPDMYVVGAGQVDAALTEIDARARREKTREAGLAALDRLLAETKAQLVVIDPLSAAVPVGQNDNGVAAAVMLELKKIAERWGCGFLIVAHTRKGAQADISGAEVTAGAGAWVNLARVVKLIRVPDAATLAGAGAPFGAAHRVREIVTLKSNLAPAGGPEFFVLESEGAGNGTATEPPDFVGVAAPFAPASGGPVATMPQAALKDVLTAIATGVGGAPLSMAHQSRKRHAVPILAAAMAPHYPQVQNAAVLEGMARSVLSDLEARGWITTAPLPVAKKGRGGPHTKDGLIVRWDATPFANDRGAGNFAC